MAASNRWTGRALHKGDERTGEQGRKSRAPSPSGALCPVLAGSANTKGQYFLRMQLHYCQPCNPLFQGSHFSSPFSWLEALLGREIIKGRKGRQRPAQRTLLGRLP